MEISNAMAVGLGMGTVFVGLICLILICYIMSAVIKLFTGDNKKEEVEAKKPAQSAVSAASTVQNKGEFAAAIACAIAEDLGTDVTGIRIKSVKRV